MMIFTLSEVSKLKQEIKELFSVQVHFHDSCGGQFFTIDEPGPGVQAFIAEYCIKKGLSPVFSEDRTRFSVTRSKL